MAATADDKNESAPRLRRNLILRDLVILPPLAGVAVSLHLWLSLRKPAIIA